MEKIVLLLKEQLTDRLVQIVLSNARNKESAFKVKIRPILLNDVLVFQFSTFIGTKVYHENLSTDDAVAKICDLMDKDFKQMQLESDNMTASVLVSKKGSITLKKKVKKLAINNNEVSSADTTDGNNITYGTAMVNGTGSINRRDLSHNRKKNYILEEGQVVPFLVDLGVQTKDGKIVKAKYDKFRQINRFLEFLEDIVPKLPKDRKVSIIDFGCGKSYLTFAMYYYLKVKRNYDIDVIGLDLKEDVIRHCNALKDKYGYENLKFLQGDIKEYNEKEEVDMVVTLHACDTATDYALLKAVKWNAKVILSVPCCQHEVNKQIQNEMLAPILKYGLLKERMSALITDGIRANLLEELGYETQILEFIDLEHTPKNIMIKAVAANKIKRKKRDVNVLLQELHVEQTLQKLLQSEKEIETI